MWQVAHICIYPHLSQAKGFWENVRFPLSNSEVPQRSPHMLTLKPLNCMQTWTHACLCVAYPLASQYEYTSEGKSREGKVQPYVSWDHWRWLLCGQLLKSTGCKTADSQRLYMHRCADKLGGECGWQNRYLFRANPLTLKGRKIQMYNSSVHFQYPPLPELGRPARASLSCHGRKQGLCWTSRIFIAGPLRGK